MPLVGTTIAPRESRLRPEKRETAMSNSVIAILRIIHIVFGTFWVGGAITTAFFLLPTVKATGPIGGQFAGQLMARTRLPTVLTAAGGITVLAGLILYGGIWAGTGFSGPPAYYAIGGVFAIIAIILGGAIARPAADKLAALGRTLTGQGTPPTADQNAEREHLMNRLTSTVQINAVLLIIAVAFMAVARYM
jgi:hypothetical protein